MGQCCGCLAWEYSGTNFTRPEGDRMAGWCRVWSKETQQGFGCEHYSSKADQEREYFARVSKAKSIS